MHLFTRKEYYLVSHKNKDELPQQPTRLIDIFSNFKENFKTKIKINIKEKIKDSLKDNNKDITQRTTLKKSS